MRRRNFKLTSLEEDLSILGLNEAILENEEEENQEEDNETNEEEDNETNEEEDNEENEDGDMSEEDDNDTNEDDVSEENEEDGDPLEERRFTRLGKARKKGPHKKGFRRIRKAGGGYYFKKVTSKMLKKEKKRRSKSSYKRKAAKSRKRLRARGFGEENTIETKIERLNSLAGLKSQESMFEQYMECLDNARKLAARLIDEFEGKEECEENINDLTYAGSLAETALSNLSDMDSLTEDVEVDLEEGIEKIVDLIHESLEKWEEMNESEESSEEIPDIFQE